jgi:hypothetical protein
MSEFIQPDKFDLIRETLIVIIGFIIRYFEKKKLKND